jgi:hypothetical protein
MTIAQKLDDFGKPAWIVLTILGFMAWWPIGLAILAFAIGSGRMGCRHGRGVGRWQHEFGRWQQEGGDRMRQAASWWHQPRSSGNRAFDEYRTDTLRRLEDEEREFRDFLHRLRMAKDKTEFDQFMAERRSRTAPSAEPSQG